ncbi:MAG: hypothetical protein ABI247_12355 [Rhodanobacter sp.]
MAVVRFIAGLMPLYDDEGHDGAWCARSLTDGTLIFPVDESDWDEERGTVKVWWQGDAKREQLAQGTHLASLALERYVRLHGVGYSEEAIAWELWYMARHFHFKTGCYVYLPQLPEPPTRLQKAGRKALQMGQGLLVNLLSKLSGTG